MGQLCAHQYRGQSSEVIDQNEEIVVYCFLLTTDYWLLNTDFQENPALDIVERNKY